jgi:hypothetical protein
MLSAVRTVAPVLTDAGVGVGVAVLVLAASAAGAGPPWIGSPRPLDAVAVGLVGVVAGALALRRRYRLTRPPALAGIPGDCGVRGIMVVGMQRRSGLRTALASVGTL